MSDRKAVSSPSSSPWSAFHSSLTVVARPPGTPVRHGQESSPVSLPSSEAISTVVDFQCCFTQLDLLVEYKLLCLNRPSGVYVLPSSKSLYGGRKLLDHLYLKWHGVLFVHSGPFRDGIFRFTMYIPDSFPRMRPMLRFHSRVYHPYIHASNGVLNMSRVFPAWDPSTHHMWHVIQYTKQCFYSHETWQNSDQESFSTQAQACAMESLKTLFDPPDDGDDSNFIRFTEMDDTLFSQAKTTLLKGGLPTPPQSPRSVFTNVSDHVKQLWDRLTAS